MVRIVARVPESVEELCLVRLGLVVRKLRALPFAARLARAIDRSAGEAIASRAGLLSSERFRFGWGHFGVLQYWSNFDALDAWSHRPPHSDWWRDALDRMRKLEDFGIYHETFLVPRAGGRVDLPELPAGRIGQLRGPGGGGRPFDDEPRPAGASGRGGMIEHGVLGRPELRQRRGGRRPRPGVRAGPRRPVRRAHGRPQPADARADPGQAGPAPRRWRRPSRPAGRRSACPGTSGTRSTAWGSSAWSSATPNWACLCPTSGVSGPSPGSAMSRSTGRRRPPRASSVAGKRPSV